MTYFSKDTEQPMPKKALADGDTLTPATPADATDTSVMDAESNQPDENNSQTSSEPDGQTPASEAPSEPQSMEEAIAAAMDAGPDATSDEGAEEAPGDEDDDDKGDTPADADASDDDEAKADDTPEKKGDEPDPEDKPGTDEDADDPTEDELKAMRPNVQKRIKQLLSQRNAARTEVTAFKGDAESYQSIRTFMSENQLVDQEVADLFKIGADLKSGDPVRLQAFLDRVTPLMQMAQEATGAAVPTDLQPQVEAGEMTADVAKEMAKTRHNATVAQAQAQTATQHTQQRDVAAVQGQITEAINGWSATTRQADPDFALKSDMLRRVSQAIVSERGMPTTPEQAVQYADDAYAEVNRALQAAKPARKATRQAPPTGASTPRSGVKAAPTSLAEAIGTAMAQ